MESDKGALTMGLLYGEVIIIGDDIEVEVQQNNTPGSRRVVLRIRAPKSVAISRKAKDEDDS